MYSTCPAYFNINSKGTGKIKEAVTKMVSESKVTLHCNLQELDIMQALLLRHALRMKKKPTHRKAMENVWPIILKKTYASCRLQKKSSYQWQGNFCVVAREGISPIDQLSFATNQNAMCSILWFITSHPNYVCKRVWLPNELHAQGAMIFFWQNSNSYVEILSIGSVGLFIKSPYSY